MPLLKSDLINGAYSQLRISGLTVSPSPANNATAISRLESMMHEWRGIGYDIGYNFTETPNTGDDANVDLKFQFAVETSLAIRLCPDFGKDIPQALLLNNSKALSSMANMVAIRKQTGYPSRMPVGKGNNVGIANFGNYFVKTSEAPVSAQTITIQAGDIESYNDDFRSYLIDAETISSYVITVDSGLTVLSDSLNTAEDRVVYSIEADDVTENTYAKLEVEITTSDGRVKKRYHDFQINKEDVG